MLIYTLQKLKICTLSVLFLFFTYVISKNLLKFNEKYKQKINSEAKMNRIYFVDYFDEEL